MELTPIKVVIKLSNGRHEYPPFNDLPQELRDGMDWCCFVDKFGGWYYDKVNGHADDGSDPDPVLNSPRGKWLGLLLVPDDFAQAAVAAFRAVTELTEAEAAKFYEQRVTANQPDIIDDKDELAVIAARKAAGVADDDDVTKALDPDSPQKGRRRNTTKTFVGLKAKKSISVKVPGK